MVSDTLRNGTRLITVNVLPDIGQGLGNFQVMMVEGHPVLHAEYVTNYGERGGHGHPSPERWVETSWREVTMADMQAYAFREHALKQQATDARLELFRYKKGSRVWILFFCGVAAYEILAKVNHILHHFGVL